MNMDLKTTGTEYIMNILSLFIWSNVIKKKFFAIGNDY